jgi:hypothetical protein
MTIAHRARGRAYGRTHEGELYVRRTYPIVGSSAVQFRYAFAVIGQIALRDVTLDGWRHLPNPPLRWEVTHTEHGAIVTVSVPVQ